MTSKLITGSRWPVIEGLGTKLSKNLVALFPGSPHMLKRGSGVLNDFSCHSSGSPIWELESDCRMRNYIRDNILRLYWWRLQSSTRLGNAMITFFMPFDPAPCDKKSRSERFQEGLVMDECDSSTLNEDCWHSTYRNFCKWHQAPFPIFGWGLGWGYFDILLKKEQVASNECIYQGNIPLCRLQFW